MTTRYFKITALTKTSPLKERGYETPIQAVLGHLREKKKLGAAAEEFAAQFGAKPVMVSSGSTCGVHGVRFPGSPEPAELWVKPDPKARFSTRPRAKGARQVKGPEMKGAHKELLELWNSTKPKRIDLDDQWLPAGYCTMDLILGGAQMVADYEGGHIYVAAGQPPERGVEWEEITGGEFQRIQGAVKDQKVEDYL